VSAMVNQSFQELYMFSSDYPHAEGFATRWEDLTVPSPHSPRLRKPGSSPGISATSTRMPSRTLTTRGSAVSRTSS
jgi:hypothetical protein